MSGGFPESDPGASGLHQRWYEANADAAVLCAQRCECGQWRHPARYRCAVCRSDVWSFEPLGDGPVEAVVESWTVTRRPLHFGFAEAIPYAIVVARTESGCQFLVQLRPSSGDPIEIGSAVSIFVDSFGVPYSQSSTGSRSS